MNPNLSTNPQDLTPDQPLQPTTPEPTLQPSWPTPPAQPSASPIQVPTSQPQSLTQEPVSQPISSTLSPQTETVQTQPLPESVTPPQPKKSGFLKTFFIVIALILFGILIGVIAVRYIPLSKPVVIPTPTPTIVVAPSSSPSATLGDTTNWQTYTNSSYEYSFKYPQNWDVKESSLAGGESAVEVDTKEKIALIESRKIDTEGSVFPFSIMVRTSKPNYLSDDFELVTKEEKLLTGKMATFYSRKILTTTMYGTKGELLTTIIVPQGQKYLQIIQSRPSDTPGMFEQILSTLKFYDKTTTPTPTISLVPSGWTKREFATVKLNLYAPSDWKSGIQFFPEVPTGHIGRGHRPGDEPKEPPALSDIFPQSFCVLRSSDYYF